MNKKVITLGPKSGTTRTDAPPIDDWVNIRESAPMKRLTIDVSAQLHARIKSQCALKGVKMADELRALLEQQFHGS